MPRFSLGYATWVRREARGARRETRDEDCVHRADTARSFHRILPHRQQTAWLTRRTNSSSIFLLGARRVLLLFLLLSNEHEQGT